MKLVCGFALLGLVAGCAGVTDDVSAVEDDEAASAPIAMSGKADAPTLVGIYASHATRHYDGDIPALELRGDAHYVRGRCYRASCALEVPETDAFDVYTSSAGKTYVRFHAFVASRDTNGDLEQTPTVADVYEIESFSNGIKVRKAYSSRWQVLYASSASLACAASGGSFVDDTCTCSAGASFAPGAGGCFASVPADESRCDDTTGAWLDDDANLVGAYCACGVGRYVDATAGCADVTP
jgi:hypothetical protein